MNNKDQLLLGSIWNRKKDPECCPCPDISGDADNIIECRSDGLYATAGSGSMTGALNGLSVVGTNVVFGQSLGQSGNPAILTSPREIPTGANNVFYTGTGKMSIGYADSSVAPIPVLDVKGSLGVTVNTASYPLALNSGVGGTMHVSHQGGTWGLVVSKSGAVSANYGSLLTFYRTAGADTNTRTVVNAGQPIGSIVYQAIAADNLSVATSGAIQHRVASSTGGVVRGYFELITSEPTGFITAGKLTLSADGNVTIGTGITTLGESDLSKLRVHNTLTGSDAFNTVHFTPIWNTSGTPTAIKLNVTDSASNAASLLMDLQVGGTSVFKVGKTVPEYADNTAATGAGLTAGTIYRTADVLKIVH